MLKALRSLLSFESRDRARPTVALIQSEPPANVSAPGIEAMPFAPSLQWVNELPVPDWEAVSRWLQAVPNPEEQAIAWSACEVAWLQHLRTALGQAYYLAEHEDTLLLSSLGGDIARVTLEFVSKTQSRIMRLLDGVAQVPEWGKDILIVFEDDDTYYYHRDGSSNPGGNAPMGIEQ
jgi:hypothetical protein